MQGRSYYTKDNAKRHRIASLRGACLHRHAAQSGNCPRHLLDKKPLKESPLLKALVFIQSCNHVRALVIPSLLERGAVGEKC